MMLATWGFVSFVDKNLVLGPDFLSDFEVIETGGVEVWDLEGNFPKLTVYNHMSRWYQNFATFAFPPRYMIVLHFC